MSLTIMDVKSRAKKHGADVQVDETADYVRVYINAPSGKIWTEGDVHSLVAEWFRDDPGFKQEEILEAMKRMEFGLEDCPEKDCGECK